MINTGISFIAFLAIFFAFNCIEGNKNTVNLCHDKEIKTALSQIQKSLASLEEKISAIQPNRRGK